MCRCPEAGAAAVGEWSLAPRDRIVLDILGRHPFLADGALADVLGRTVGWARARRAELVRRGLARVLDPDELRIPLQGRRELVEVTVEGLRMLAGYVGLSLAASVRHHGFTGGGPKAPVGPRRALLANLAHTLGADVVFAAIARAARTQRQGALVEWRNAAASAHVRLSQVTLLECVAQLRPTGDPEFGEDAVQVPTHGAVREKEALADLTVGQSFGRELRDLQLLGVRRSRASGVRRPIA